jgi:RNA polymerase sigma-70 factor (ECF subfamily)
MNPSPGTFPPSKLNMKCRRQTGEPMSASEDDELMARIAAGDRDAFGELYRRRRADVYRFALHLGGSGALADDVTQEVFLAVIALAVRYRPDRSGALPWLLGIARNHVRRALGRGRTIALDDAEGDRALRIEGDPIAGLARREHGVAVRRALATLPWRYREVIVLCDVQDMSYADAAAAIGCAVGTVRSRLHRGRARLVDALRGSGDAALRTPVTSWML